MASFSPDSESSHSFGFSRVSAAEKTQRVRSVFRDVAPRYDVMNDLMSAGLHRAWKRTFIDLLAPKAGTLLLDMASGTGDIAHRCLERAPGLSAIACDPSYEMLNVERARAIDRGFLQNLTRIVARAEELPYPADHFDYYTMVFGFRNVTDRAAALAEAFRVLKPGGQCLIMEFSMPKSGVKRALYDAYSFHVIPKLGGLITGNGEHYRYLVESIRMFPLPDTVSSMFTHAGFEKVRHRSLTQGVVSIFSGWKI